MEISRNRSVRAVVATGAETTVGLDPAKKYVLVNTGRDSSGVSQAAASVFGTLDDTAVVANFSKTTDAIYLNPACDFAPPVIINGVTVLRLLALSAELVVQITQVAPNILNQPRV